MECVAGAAAVAVIAVLVPAGMGAFGRGPGPSAQGQRPAVPAVYVSYDGPGWGAVIPITIATNTPGKPIKVGRVPTAIAITPDGKTAYVSSEDSSTVTPITTATNTAGKPIKVGPNPRRLASTPVMKAIGTASTPP